MKWPLIQIVLRPAKRGGRVRRWHIGRSVTDGSTLNWIYTPLLHLNFWRPRRMSLLRWVRPQIVRCR